MRYIPCSTMLNSISREFRHKEYGAIPSPSSRTNKEEIVFVPYDMFPIMSDDSSAGLPCERLPDIIGVFLSFLCGNSENYENYDLTAMANEVAVRRVPKEREQASGNRPVEYPRTEWKDIHLSVKLDYGKATAIPEGWNKEDILKSSSVQGSQSIQTVETGLNARSAANPATISTISGFDFLPAVVSEPLEKLEINTRKRVREEERAPISLDERPQKIPRRNSSPLTNPASCESMETRVPPDVQCTYYGKERLSASFTITHSIVVLIEGMVIYSLMIYMK